MKNILLVEDDPALRKGIIHGLGLTHYSFQECGSKQEAQTSFLHTTFDLLMKVG